MIIFQAHMSFLPPKNIQTVELAQVATTLFQQFFKKKTKICTPALAYDRYGMVGGERNTFLRDCHPFVKKKSVSILSLLFFVTIVGVCAMRDSNRTTFSFVFFFFFE